jgi:hypothetical protein
MTIQDEEMIIKALSELAPLDYQRIMSKVRDNREKWKQLPKGTKYTFLNERK